MNKLALAAVVLALSCLMSSCAPMRSFGIPEPGDPKPAGALNEHFIIVTVVAGQVAVDVSELQIRGNRHKITWYLDNADGQDFEFSADSINLQEKSAQRYQCRRQGKYHFRCEDTGAGAGRFKYDVKVRGATSLDPLVVNN